MATQLAGVRVDENGGVARIRAQVRAAVHHVGVHTARGIEPHLVLEVDAQVVLVGQRLHHGAGGLKCRGAVQARRDQGLVAHGHAAPRIVEGQGQAHHRPEHRFAQREHHAGPREDEQHGPQPQTRGAVHVEVEADGRGVPAHQPGRLPAQHEGLAWRAPGRGQVQADQAVEGPQQRGEPQHDGAPGIGQGQRMVQAQHEGHHAGGLGAQLAGLPAALKFASARVHEDLVEVQWVGLAGARIVECPHRKAQRVARCCVEPDGIDRGLRRQLLPHTFAQFEPVEHGQVGWPGQVQLGGEPVVEFVLEGQHATCQTGHHEEQPDGQPRPAVQPDEQAALGPPGPA